MAPVSRGKARCAKVIKRDHPDARYATFDDDDHLGFARDDPKQFFLHPESLFIVDEVQRAAELFTTIKWLVDRDRRPGRFLFTGSANVLLMPKLSDSLAGRMEILTLLPLSMGELDSQNRPLLEALFASDEAGWLFQQEPDSSQAELLFQRSVMGGYPEIQMRTNEQRRSGWFRTYLEAIVNRDIRELSQIEDGPRFRLLLQLVAARSGSLLNFAEFSRSSQIPASTLKRYFALLQAVYILHLLPAWSDNAGKRVTRSPKVHLLDTGLLCHLLGLNEQSLRQDCPQFGRVLESLVVNEFMKLTTWSFPQVDLYHYRTHAGAKVDLVLRQLGGALVGVEIKATTKITSRDVRGLKSLQEEAGDQFVRGVILYLGTQPMRIGEKLWAIPLAQAMTA